MTQLRPLALLCLCGVAAAPLHAENFLLRSGQRLAVTGYERIGDSYRLQISGGVVEVAAADVVAIEPQDDFPALGTQSATKFPYQELIQSAAQRYGIDADLIASVIAVESSFDSRAVSRRDARGLMQLLPETAKRLGVRDVFNPGENIDAGTRYLKALLARYDNDLVLALAAFNAGPERVQQYGNVPPFAETRSYVRRVRRDYDRRKTRNTPQTTAQLNMAKKKNVKTAGL